LCSSSNIENGLKIPVFSGSLAGEFLGLSVFLWAFSLMIFVAMIDKLEIANSISSSLAARTISVKPSSAEGGTNTLVKLSMI